MLSSLPRFYAFCWSAIPTSCYIFNVFYSCSCYFFLAAHACLIRSFPSITEQQVSPHRLPMKYWLKNHRLSPRTWTVFLIQQSCVIITFSLLSDLCACVHVKKKWRHKGSHSSSVSGSNRLVWLQTWKKAMGWCITQWKMLLFCAKTILKESRKFELACLKKKKKEKHFGRLATFWFGTFAMLFSATRCVFRHENARKWTIGCYNGL